MKAQQKEGCQVYGYLEVNKVQGNFHFAPGKSFQQHHVHGRSSSFLLGRELQKAVLMWVFKKIKAIHVFGSEYKYMYPVLVYKIKTEFWDS